MKTIHFDGAIAQLAGCETVEMDVKNAQDLVSALNSQVKGFRKFAAENKIILAASKDGMEDAKAIVSHNREMTFEGRDHLWVVPAFSGSGIETAIIAAVGATGAAAVAITVAVNLAVSLVTSAIIKALAPSPDSSEGPAEAAKRPSFLFNGSILTYEQGYAIPLIYGNHHAAGIVIGTDIDVEDIPFDFATMFPDPAGGASGRGHVPAEAWMNNENAGDM